MTRHPLSPAAGALVRSALDDATKGTGRVGFDRRAYLHRIGDLALAAMRTARKQGMANCGHYDDNPQARAAVHAEHDAALEAFLNALNTLPRELDDMEIEEKVA